MFRPVVAVMFLSVLDVNQAQFFEINLLILLCRQLSRKTNVGKSKNRTPAQNRPATM
jgi:hypothetical protein